MVSNNEIGYEIFGRPIAGTAMAISIYFTKENDDRNDDLYNIYIYNYIYFNGHFNVFQYMSMRLRAPIAWFLLQAVGCC